MWPLINLYFLFIAQNVIILGILINYLQPRLPKIIVQTFLYGKFAAQGPKVPGIIEFPKSSFRHFYVVAVLLFSATCYIVVETYFFTFEAPEKLLSILDFFCNPDRTATCTPLAVILSIFLLTLQSYKRFYETFFVSVFSKESKINLAQYVLGHTHYIGCVIAILGHAPGFINKDENIAEIPLFDVTTIFMMLISLPLFYVAWVNQFRSNQILANLRKDKKSKYVVSEKHFIPKGGWFEVISCPHQLCEILMYVALTYLLGMNTAWWCILLWVVSNQIETSLLSHWWYQKTFLNYPKRRKALIPFIF